MNEDDEKRIAAKLARIMAMLCVRNTKLETLHSGLTPVTRTPDRGLFGCLCPRCGRSAHSLERGLAHR